MKLLNIIKADLLKIRESDNIKELISALLFNSSFKVIFFYRLHKRTHFKIIKFFIRILKCFFETRYNVYISEKAEIGKGFHIGHPFSIIISECKIGENVTIMQQTTIGSSRGGNRPGYPSIGNNCFIACGAKIIGKVTIGNNCIIGANCVVTKDIPNNAIVGGVPGKIINYNGALESKYWCENIADYIKLLK